ncbi:hypothetical protein AURDEDRAFT_185379 [Auricularia subglabra TFB-10046 SS5]|nr:hypothetical protein AURDEDRAFT_185379 [Auricularia subglabra TFB-10046 SS5]
MVDNLTYTPFTAILRDIVSTARLFPALRSLTDTNETGIALDLLSERLQRVHSITVDENLWPLFGPQLVLSSLRELTVHLSPLLPSAASWAADGLLADYTVIHGAERSPKLPLSLLRLVAPPDTSMPGLEESVVADVVQAMLDPNALRALVLCGVDLVSQPSGGPVRSLVPQLQIRNETRPEVEAPQPWFWKFPEYEAIHI